jgi:hypothetical protein
MAVSVSLIYVSIHLSICLSMAFSISLSVCLSIYLWVYSTFLLDLGRFFSFLILYVVGRTPWTGYQPVARPLPAHRINAHTDIHASCGLRTHDPSVRAGEEGSCHCDRPSYMCSYFLLQRKCVCVCVNTADWTKSNWRVVLLGVWELILCFWWLYGAGDRAESRVEWFGMQPC